MGTNTSAVLPAEFSDLEPFAAKWCLASESERAASDQVLAQFSDEISERAHFIALEEREGEESRTGCGPSASWRRRDHRVRAPRRSLSSSPQGS